MKEKKYVVGITGHRDLKSECLSHYEEQVNKLLIRLKKQHQNIVIYSPLADGSDRILVREGLKLKIPFIVILPMQKDIYKLDFHETSFQEFEILIKQAQKVITMGLIKGNTLQEIATYSKERDMQYEACGEYIADNCDLLVALWDGKFIKLVGGTGEIVKYYLDKDIFHLLHLKVFREKDLESSMLEFGEYTKTSRNKILE